MLEEGDHVAPWSSHTPHDSPANLVIAIGLILDASVRGDPVLAEATFRRWARLMSEHGIDESEAQTHFANWATEERYFSIADELSASPAQVSAIRNASGNEARSRSTEAAPPAKAAAGGDPPGTMWRAT